MWLASLFKLSYHSGEGGLLKTEAGIESDVRTEKVPAITKKIHQYSQG